jgi:hypothetical protein
LSLRGSGHLTDGGLLHLAQLRGSTVLRRSASIGLEAEDGSGSGGGGGSNSSSSSSSDAYAGLEALNLSGCTGLTEQCWLAITEVGAPALWQFCFCC